MDGLASAVGCSVGEVFLCAGDRISFSNTVGVVVGVAAELLVMFKRY